jgi:type IV pilus assembly protein PilA
MCTLAISTMSHPVASARGRRLAKRFQAGMTLIELTIVLLIIGLIGLFIFTGFNGIVIGTKVDPTAKDTAAAVLRLRVNAEGTGTTPYAGMTTAALANTLRGRTTVMTVAGAGNAATVSHSLGATGSAITAAPATITTAGDAFTISFPTVNKAACPSFAAALRNVSQIITINGTAVHSIPGGIAFNGQTAENLCTADDTNTFVFTVR